MDEIEATMALERTEQDWRPVSIHWMATLFDDAHKVQQYEGAKDTYWDMYADQLVAPCTVFTAITLLQRCLLSAEVMTTEVHTLPIACLWVAIKVAEGQDAGGLLSAAVMCHEWNQFSAVTVQVHELLPAEHRALFLLRVDVMKHTSFDTFVLCLRLSRWTDATRQDAYERALALLILVEGRPETLSYTATEVAAALCRVVNVPVPPALCVCASDEARCARAVQYLESFEMEE
jgi:hypothetical protein